MSWGVLWLHAWNCGTAFWFSWGKLTLALSSLQLHYLNKLTYLRDCSRHFCLCAWHRGTLWLTVKLHLLITYLLTICDLLPVFVIHFTLNSSCNSNSSNTHDNYSHICNHNRVFMQQDNLLTLSDWHVLQGGNVSTKDESFHKSVKVLKVIVRIFLTIETLTLTSNKYRRNVNKVILLRLPELVPWFSDGIWKYVNSLSQLDVASRGG